jgi:carbamoyl-phosphate synthase large subunit
MAGEKLKDFNLKETRPGHMAVKEAVFPFARFPDVDIILGPEMKSTGEVMGLDRDFAHAFAKAQLAVGSALPQDGAVFISVRDHDKTAAVEICRQLTGLGFTLVATRGTARTLSAAGLKVETINKVLEGQPHIVDALKDDRIALLVNTTEGAKSIADSFSLRRTALFKHVPYTTTIAGARALVQAIAAVRDDALDVWPLQSYAALSD